MSGLIFMNSFIVLILDFAHSLSLVALGVRLDCLLEVFIVS